MMLPELDTDRAVLELTSFLTREFESAGFSHAVVGLSGGIDSSVTTALSARALGSENVWAVLMPYAMSAPENIEDARAVVAATGVNDLFAEITPQIDAYFDLHPDADRVRRGNKMARERMTILYDLSYRLDALVVGTSNRTEALLGYTTLHGDHVCALNPLAPLYKAWVRDVARALGLPERVIAKPPSADLWRGQTDEDELGFTYAEVDPLLYAMFDLAWPREKLIAEGFDVRLIDRVGARHQATAFKRRVAPGAALSAEAFRG